MITTFIFRIKIILNIKAIEKYFWFDWSNFSPAEKKNLKLRFYLTKAF